MVLVYLVQLRFGISLFAVGGYVQSSPEGEEDNFKSSATLS